MGFEMCIQSEATLEKKVFLSTREQWSVQKARMNGIPIGPLKAQWML